MRQYQNRDLSVKRAERSCVRSVSEECVRVRHESRNELPCRGKGEAL